MVNLLCEGGMVPTVPTEEKMAHLIELWRNHWPVFHSRESECQHWWPQTWGVGGRGIWGRESRRVRQESHALANPKGTRRPRSCEPETFFYQGSEKQPGLPKPEGFLSQGSEKQPGLTKSVTWDPQRLLEKSLGELLNTDVPWGQEVPGSVGWQGGSGRESMIRW